MWTLQLIYEKDKLPRCSFPVGIIDLYPSAHGSAASRRVRRHGSARSRTGPRSQRSLHHLPDGGWHRFWPYTVAHCYISVWLLKITCRISVKIFKLVDHHQFFLLENSTVWITNENVSAKERVKSGNSLTFLSKTNKGCHQLFKGCYHPCKA